MIAGKTRSNSDRLYVDDSLKLIKFAAIYGANASGKSNLIKAIDFARTIIVNKIPAQSIVSFAKVNKLNKTRESSFEFEIELKGKYYAYGFDILLSEQAIKSEWLYEITKTSTKEIFKRNTKNGEYSINEYFKNKDLINKLEVFIDVIKDDESALFLHDINLKKDSLYKEFSECSVLKEVYLWFLKKLDVNYANRPLKNSYNNIFDENVSCKIENYLKIFGTGINKVITHEVTREEIKEALPQGLIENIIEDLHVAENKNIIDKRILLNLRGEGFFLFELKDDGTIVYKTLQFNHGDNDLAFLLSEESDGNQRLMELLSVLLSEEDGKVFVIDEIDRCLHPLLTKKYVSTFLEIAKKKNIQLIVTTHESQLMDFNLLRKDEIWLLNKDNKGKTKVYSMDEFNERFDKKIIKSYLAGRYGGIPEFHKNLLNEEPCEE
jgi:AAA15 family ATPase/GTPase